MKEIQDFYKIQWAKPEDLISYSKNNKVHPEEQILRLVCSIQEFGFDVPCVVDVNKVLIKGEGRKQAAMKMGMKLIPYIVRDDLTPEQVIASRIADNASSSLDYNKDFLRFDLKTLEMKEFNLSTTALKYNDIQELLKDIPIDGVPDLKLDGFNGVPHFHGPSSSGEKPIVEPQPVKDLTPPKKEYEASTFENNEAKEESSDNFEHECPNCQHKFNSPATS